MHGRKKVPIDEATRIKAEQKAKALGKLVTSATDSLETDEGREALVKSDMPVLDTLDDFATLWNLRKKHVLEEPTNELLENELKIAERVVRKNPKCYWAWHHRRWCAEKLETFDYNHELELCDLFLEADNRNFHAWRHRRWAASKAGDVYDKELEKMTKMLERDPANFSAWHYRSQLPNLTDLKGEIDLAKSAFWTDPQDQGPWIYYRWLINHQEIASDSDYIKEELEQMHELIECDESKYPYLASLWLLRKLPDSDASEIETVKSKLKEIDPIHAAFYEEQ